MDRIGEAGDAQFARAVSAALLPALLERIRGATGALADLRADLERSREPDGAGAAERDTEELGWLFGVIAAGLGADVLIERRRRAALEPVVALARTALARTGRGLAARAPLPELALEARAAQALAFGLASFFWRAGSAARGELGWDWSVDGAALRVTAQAPADAECACFLERTVAGAALRQAGGRWDWSLPAAWFAARAPV